MYKLRKNMNNVGILGLYTITGVQLYLVLTKLRTIQDILSCWSAQTTLKIKKNNENCSKFLSKTFEVIYLHFPGHTNRGWRGDRDELHLSVYGLVTVVWVASIQSKPALLQ